MDIVAVTEIDDIECRFIDDQFIMGTTYDDTRTIYVPH